MRVPAGVTNQTHYRLLRLVAVKPGASQRDFAQELGISLGKVNYCLRALIRTGCIKVTNFTNSQNKAAYLYLLTPRGVEEKAKLTARFLQTKMQEYERLRLEIEQIREEVVAANKDGQGAAEA